DVSPYRLALARQVGADHAFAPGPDAETVILDHTGGEGVDSALEMSGHPAAVRLCFRAVKNAGRVALFGIPNAPIPLDLANDVIFKGLRVQGVTGRRLFETWYRLAGLFRAGLDIRPIVTHQFPLAQFEKGFELMHTGGCGKVVLVP
ncbi:MAG TPA: zinc-binding dehydrogenase, partial [Gemmataceae bacterium]|nr:zinc-binding dehydrogenase [Gemmataceae bacterium]